ncbi:hypothetical protein P7K49_009242, partial [Saguinus oedipus]
GHPTPSATVALSRMELWEGAPARAPRRHQGTEASGAPPASWSQGWGAAHRPGSSPSIRG